MKRALMIAAAFLWGASALAQPGAHVREIFGPNGVTDSGLVCWDGTRGDRGKDCGAVNMSRVVLDAGSTAAGTAPLQFTTGDLMTVVEPGSLEYDRNCLFFTNYLVRRSVVQGQEVVTADVTVANDATETTVFTQPHGADYLRVGKAEEILIVGRINSTLDGDANTLTVRVKYASGTLATFVVPEANRTNVAFELHILTTVRAVGAGTTSIQFHANFDLNGTAVDSVVDTLSGGHDSTIAEPTTVTFQWSDAKAANSASISQGYALSIDDN